MQLVTRTGSTTTSAPGMSAAASAWWSERKPRTTGTSPISCRRYGSGAMPMPPPTRSGRSTSSRNPFPSGPKTWIPSPGSSAHSAEVPGPTASRRNASSPGGARQSESARGRSRPGASSMKNCPGAPGSREPRSTRSSVYAPTESTPVTLRRSRLGIDPLLQRQRMVGARVRDRVHGGGRAGDGGDARNATRQRGLANRISVRARVASLGRVYDEIAPAAPDEIDDGELVAVGLAELADRLDVEPGTGERRRGSFRRVQTEAETRERRRDRHRCLLLGRADGEEYRSLVRQRAAGCALRLGERGRQIGGARHHLAGRSHLVTEDRVAAGAPRERKNRGLHAPLLRRPLARQPEVGDARAGGEPTRRGNQLHARRLAHERNRARRARVRLEDVEVAAGRERDLDVEKADDAERAAERAYRVLDLLLLHGRQTRRGQDARRVAGVDSRLLDVLHDRGDVGVEAVAQRVDVDLDRILEKAVDEHAAEHRHLAHLVVAEADAHRPAAEDVRRTDEHRVADLVRHRDRLVARRRHPPPRRADVVRAQEAREALAVLGEVDRVVRRPQDLVAGLLDRARELQRRLPAELDDDALRPLPVADGEHRLGVERLEVQAVTRVVVGGDRLRVAVHHHRLVAQLAERPDRVHAAVVELDALPDAVRSAAEDDDARLCGLQRP